MLHSFHDDGAQKVHVSHEKFIVTIPAEEGAAHSASEVLRCHDGCGFGAGGAPYALSRCGRVVGGGGGPAAQVGVGAARVCCRLLPRCLLGPGCSFVLIFRLILIGLSPHLLCPLLLIALLPPLSADAVPSSRAEVVDRDDTVKHRCVATVLLHFGPGLRVPCNTAKELVVLVQKDCDVSVISPDNLEPV